MRNRIQRDSVVLGLALCLFFSVVGLQSSAQTSAPKVPTELVLNTADDYAQYKGLVKKCLSWLVKTPLDQDSVSRSELNAFVILWLSGTPDITVDVKTSCMPFLQENEELFFTFLHGTALYQIKHPGETDKVKLHAEGLKAVAFQVRETKCSKSKEIKAILKADKKNRLDEYVTNCIDLQ